MGVKFYFIQSDAGIQDFTDFKYQLKPPNRPPCAKAYAQAKRPSNPPCAQASAQAKRLPNRPPCAMAYA